jgi:hypothetical protein
MPREAPRITYANNAPPLSGQPATEVMRERLLREAWVT